MAVARSVLDRFFEKTARLENGCLLWTGYRQKRRGKISYGRFRTRAGEGGLVLAHVFAWEFHFGVEVPIGKQLDHGCRNEGCVEWAHAEPVTAQENAHREQRANGRGIARTHCPTGHAYTPQNTYRNGNKRFCRQCSSTAQRRYQQRRAS